MPTLEEMVSKLRPRPTRMQERPTHPELAVEHDRFVAMLPELMKTIPDKWIAMKDGEVIAVANDEVSALTAAYRLRGGLMFLSVKVTDQPIPMDRIPIGRLREVPRAKPPGREDIPMIVDTTPKAFPRRPVHPELAAEHDRFQELLPELLKTHRDKWIAMKDGQIVAVGEDEVDVLTQAGEKQPGVLHHARLVTDQPLPIMRSGKFRELPPS